MKKVDWMLYSKTSRKSNLTSPMNRSKSLSQCYINQLDLEQVVPLKGFE